VAVHPRNVERPKSRPALWEYVRRFFGLVLPYKKFTRGHSSPFDFVADGFFNPGQDIAAWASRSGLKTLGASILAALEYRFYDCIQARVLSGSEDQARFLYEYWQRWCSTVLADRLDGDVNRLLTRVAGGKLEILAASQRRVRGGKVQRLYEDELDEIDPTIDAAAVGMIASTHVPGRTVYTSTWHRADGLMGRLVDACPDNGVRLHKWNIWESIECCPEDRHQLGRGCEHCALAPVCVAKAREFHARENRKVGIAAEGMGVYRIDDAVKAFRKVSRATWQAEYECGRPTVEGLVYSGFDQCAHRCDRPPQELRLFRSIDWGMNVFVCLWLGVDKDGMVYLLDTYRAENAHLSQHADYIKSHRLRDIEATYCDPAGRNRSDQTGKSNVEFFRERGIVCTYTLSASGREVRNGIQLVRAALRSASGQVRFFYVANDNNRIFVKAMQNYRSRKVNALWIDAPAEPQEFEHIPDALRYFFVNRRMPRAIGRVRLGAS